MNINEKLLDLIEKIDYAAEYTKEEVITSYQSIDKPWHLTKNGKTLRFDNQVELAEYLNISTQWLSKCFNSVNKTWFKENGYTVIKLVMVDGKVRIKQ